MHLTDLIIIGAGGHGKVAADIAYKMNKWSKLMFLDDNLVGQNILGVNVVGKIADFSLFLETHDFFVAIGTNSTRAKITYTLEEHNASIATLIHPSAVIGNDVEIANGSIVIANAVINACSRIGKGCIINTGSTVDHDSNIENFVHISPGAHLGGNVNIGKQTWIGIGACIIQGVNILNNVIIGAGSVVINDIGCEGTYVGTPARKL